MLGLTNLFIMFKKFSQEDVNSSNILKSSTQRAMKKTITETYPLLTEEIIEEIFPKKSNIIATKCSDRLMLYSLENEGIPLFFQHYDSVFVPTLRLLHKYPNVLPSVRVDTGAIKHIINGADVMAPGLTSTNAFLPKELKADNFVSVFAEDMNNAMSVGMMIMTSEEILKENQGRAIENVHFLNDGLWKIKKIET